MMTSRLDKDLDYGDGDGERPTLNGIIIINSNVIE